MTLATLLRDLPVELTQAPRRTKSLIIAQLLAYGLPLRVEEDLEAHYQGSLPAVKATLRDINEALVVDIPLTLNLYKRLLDARLDAVMSPANPTLLNAILTSDEQGDRLDADSRELLRKIANHDFQREIVAHLNAPQDAP